MSVSRTLLGTVVIAFGVAALALAHDIRAWNDAVDQGDAAFAAQPGAPTGRRARGSLPTRACARPAPRRSHRPSRRAGVRRRECGSRGFDNGRRKAQLRALAELALSDTVAGGTPTQASRAGNLLGILAAATETADDPAAGDVAPPRPSRPPFAPTRPTSTPSTISSSLLRRIRVVGSREGAGTSTAGDYGAALAGAGAGLPGAGY